MGSTLSGRGGGWLPGLAERLWNLQAFQPEAVSKFALQALTDAGIGLGSDAFEKLDKTRAGVLIGSGMGGLTVFQDGVKNLVEKGYKKITPFFIPYAITNMYAPSSLAHQQC